jgi:hypothetical protein
VQDHELLRQGPAAGEVGEPGQGLVDLVDPDAADLLQRALDTALGFQTGVVDRVIAVGRADGQVIARAGALDAEPPMSRGSLGTEWEPSADGASAWAQREVISDGEIVALAAVQLAFPHLIERRQALFRKDEFILCFTKRFEIFLKKKFS